jgi:hypothetical protein
MKKIISKFIKIRKWKEYFSISINWKHIQCWYNFRLLKPRLYIDMVFRWKDFNETGESFQLLEYYNCHWRVLIIFNKKIL